MFRIGASRRVLRIEATHCSCRRLARAHRGLDGQRGAQAMPVSRGGRRAGAGDMSRGYIIKGEFLLRSPLPIALGVEQNTDWH